MKHDERRSIRSIDSPDPHIPHVLRRQDDIGLVLEQLERACVIIDATGKVSFVSHVAEQLLGASNEACCGQRWEFLFGHRRPVTVALRNLVERRDPTCGPLVLALGDDLLVGIDSQRDPWEPSRQILFLTLLARTDRPADGTLETGNGMIGESTVWNNTLELIHGLAAVDVSVLITGETGAGKEIAAHAIHQFSGRREHPFIAINCAGLTDSLLASQLFGHRRGAFTGADRSHRGFFETANGGTLLMDEIGDISPAMQSSLLRVLEERAIIRVGETKLRPIDLRVITSTNRDLFERVQQGHFRSDLLYRIQVARLTMPPLRERGQDVMRLAEVLLAQHSPNGNGTRHLSPEAKAALVLYSWPGNVRELKNAIQFAVLSGSGPSVMLADLPPEITAHSPRSPQAILARSKLPESLRAALTQARGNRRVAAKLLGISRATLYRRLGSLSQAPGHDPP